MNEPPKTKHEAEASQGSPAQRRVIHRVCITCNGMFRVPPENYEAKHCPNCHKGGG